MFGPGDRTLGPPDLSKSRSDSRSRLRHPDMGTEHDVRHTDQERSTSNVQRSTFNGVTERADGGPNMGTDTMFGGWRRK